MLLCPHKGGKRKTMFLPRRIKQCRKALKLSQEKFLHLLAREGLEISRPTLSNIERGVTFPDADQLATISLATNKPITYFFTPKHSQAGKGTPTSEIVQRPI